MRKINLLFQFSLIVLFLSSCQKENIQLSDEITPEIISPSFKKSETINEEKVLLEGSSKLKKKANAINEIIISTDYLIVSQYQYYHIVLPQLYSPGLSLETDDCIVLFNTDSFVNWESTVNSHIEDDLNYNGTNKVRFRINNLTLLSYDCDTGGSGDPHSVCNETGNELYITKGANGCIFGSFILDENIENVTINLHLLVDPNYCSFNC